MNMYKVIKPYGVAEKGDIFEQKDGLYVMEFTNEDYGKSMVIDSNTADFLCKEGYLLKVDKHGTKDTVATTLDLIDSLTKEYHDNLTEVNEKADKGELPACVAVEARTVYYNLTKVLNKIKKELLDE